MPGDTTFLTGLSFWGANLTIAVANGTVPEWRLDDACVRIMSAYYFVGRDEARVPVNFDSWSQLTYAPIHFAVESPIGLVNEHVEVRDEHAGLIRQIGHASTVLLKNSNNALPLSGKERQLGVFGEDAGSNPWGANGCSDRGCDNGTLAMGWGSGTANFPYLITPEAALQDYVSRETDSMISVVTAQGATEQVNTLAPLVDVALIFVNADAGEGYISVDGNVGDRNNLTLWKQGDELIKNISAMCSNTIVVMHTVGPVLVTDWYDNENVTAILWAGLPGQESGNAIVDVLYGHYNPGGKLPFTLGPTRESYGVDVLYEPNNGPFDAPQDDFTEGVYIDYRSFDKSGITPIYEFGFGLSYTTFEYSDLVINPEDAGPYVPSNGMTSAAPSLGQNASMQYAEYLFPNESISRIPLFIYPYLNSTDPAVASGDPAYGLPTDDYVPEGATDGSPQPLLPAGGAPGGNPGLWTILYTVTATITNTGSVLGDEVAQLYVSLGGDEPPVVLRGFDRLSIGPGESATFTAPLTRRDLSVWDTTSQNWAPAPGPVTVFVGSSSRSLPLSGPLSSSYR
jgi:beta-glucosidase